MADTDEWISCYTPNGYKVGHRVIVRQSSVASCPTFYTNPRPATKEEIERELSDQAGTTKRSPAPNPWQYSY